MAEDAFQMNNRYRILSQRTSLVVALDSATSNIFKEPRRKGEHERMPDMHKRSPNLKTVLVEISIGTCSFHRYLESLYVE
jgi:hypothetical protein